MEEKYSIGRGVLLLIIFALLSYIFTSMTVWTTDGKYLFVSRYLRINQHNRVISGENFAPDQYRFGSYYLVENLFKFLPIEWLDENSEELSRMLLSRDYWTEEKKGMIDSYFPVAEREKLVSDGEKVIEELVDSVTGKNILLNNALKAFASSLNWQVYLTDPATTALLIGERLPEDIKRAVELSSDENRILNGHITARFFFNILTLILLYGFCRVFSSPSESLLSTVAFQAIMPLTTMYFGWETFHGAALFIGGLLLIAKRGRFYLLCLLMALGSLFRPDHMIFLSLIYLLFNLESGLSWQKRAFILSKSLIAGAIPAVLTFVVSRFIFPDAEYSVDLIQLRYNMTYIWSWIYPMIFASIPLLFLREVKRCGFFRKTWFWVIPFIAMNFLIARTAEVRLFTPVIAFLAPLIGIGLQRFFPGRSMENTAIE
ncbi:hypothetical protein [Mesotoga sp. BH458_6_3_2_1]|uniref:hypothetical protein n=1 Tax=Mesotoga sp. BH458_6_3_2_1 TaxID=1437446 RepID=UPI000EF201DE|nr:hypothetical protein [Mesotoga sp. BH458_6_3_2_1]RLL86453.1 hypothetical protein Y697_05385 [Mesotoga sp. BH458_6_3_2_1]